MSLRLRLVLAFGYVLLFAIIALEVPLTLNFSRRVDSEIKAEASAGAQAVAAAASGRLTDPAPRWPPSPASRAGAWAAGCIVVDARGRVLVDSDGAAVARRAVRQPPRDRPGAARGHLAGHAPQRLAQGRPALHGGADRRRRPRRRRRAPDAERQGGQRRGAPRRPRSARPRRRRAGARAGPRVGDRRLALAPAARPGAHGAPDRRRRPAHARHADRLGRAGRGGQRLQRHDRPARARARRPARLRRQRLAPAAHPADRAAPAPGVGEPARRGSDLKRDLVAGELETERLAKLLSNLLRLAQDGQPATTRDLDRPRRRGRARRRPLARPGRARRPRRSSSPARARRTCAPRPATSTPWSTTSWRTP